MTRQFPRWRVRSLLVATAGLALMMGLARSMLIKPYPTESEDIGAFQIVYWSDDTVTTNGDRTSLVDWQNYAPIVRVHWSDGTSTTHLRRTGH